MLKDSGLLLLAQEDCKFGVYDMLSSFFGGVKKAFEKENTNVWWINEANESNAKVSLSFNVAGIDAWKEILNSGCSHIMWTVDSCFYQNFHFIREYMPFPKFHVLGLTKADIEPLNYFFPEFKNYHYLPLGVDPNVWKYENQEKDLEIVYLASVKPPEEIINTAKERLPANLFETFMDMFNFLKMNPHGNIWELYKELFLSVDDNVDKLQHACVFNYFFQQLTYLISYTKRIELVKSIEDIGIKIWGNDEWLKYVSGKNQYMGAANFEDAVKILPRSKISLNLQPLQIFEGLHDRILNSIMSESAVLCDAIPEIKNTFGDSIMYYDVKNFSNIKQKALSLLSNKEMREQKIQKAKEIVLKDHTWDSRAKFIKSVILETEKII